MKTSPHAGSPEESDIAAFEKWLQSKEGSKAVDECRSQSKEEALIIESISHVEMQKLKEPFTIKP